MYYGIYKFNAVAISTDTLKQNPMPGAYVFNGIDLVSNFS